MSRPSHALSMEDEPTWAARLVHFALRYFAVVDSMLVAFFVVGLLYALAMVEPLQKQRLEPSLDSIRVWDSEPLLKW